MFSINVYKFGLSTLDGIAQGKIDHVREDLKITAARKVVLAYWAPADQWHAGV
jgi:hypothetical protein